MRLNSAPDSKSILIKSPSKINSLSAKMNPYAIAKALNSDYVIFQSRVLSKNEDKQRLSQGFNGRGVPTRSKTLADIFRFCRIRVM